MNFLELSQTIRSIRQAQGMTVEQLAKKSGFSKGFISQVENFRQTPSLKALVRIADALGVSLSTLFTEPENGVPEYTFGQLDNGVEVERSDSEMYNIRYLALAYSQIGRRMDPFVIEYRPGEARDFLLHDTEEFFVLLEGELNYFLYDDRDRKSVV